MEWRQAMLPARRNITGPGGLFFLNPPPWGINSPEPRRLSHFQFTWQFVACPRTGSDMDRTRREDEFRECPGPASPLVSSRTENAHAARDRSETPLRAVHPAEKHASPPGKFPGTLRV